VGEGEFAQCMDLARFYLRVRDGRVEEARFQAYGCGPTLAACSAATEVAVGIALEALAEIEEGRIEAAVDGLPLDRRHAAEVVALALRAAARDAMMKAGVH
jgi:NifU-like protein involved in Fe-S cluster formation